MGTYVYTLLKPKIYMCMCVYTYIYIYTFGFNNMLSVICNNTYMCGFYIRHSKFCLELKYIISCIIS